MRYGVRKSSIKYRLKKKRKTKYSVCGDKGMRGWHWSGVKRYNELVRHVKKWRNDETAKEWNWR